MITTGALVAHVFIFGLAIAFFVTWVLNIRRVSLRLPERRQRLSGLASALSRLSPAVLSTTVHRIASLQRRFLARQRRRKELALLELRLWDRLMSSRSRLLALTYTLIAVYLLTGVYITLVFGEG